MAEEEAHAPRGRGGPGATGLTIGLWGTLALLLIGTASQIVPACGFATPGGQRLLWFCPVRADAPLTSVELDLERDRQRILDRRLDTLRLALIVAPDCPQPPAPPMARRPEPDPEPQIELAALPRPAPPPPVLEPAPARIPAPPVEPARAEDPEPVITDAALPAEPEPPPPVAVAALPVEPAPDYTPPRPHRRPVAPARPPRPVPPVAPPAPQPRPAPQPAPVPPVIPVVQPAPAATPPPPSIPARTQPAPAPAPPSDYERRLDRAGVPDRNVMVTLIWDNFNDLDLHLICPSGQPIYYANMQACGGRLDVDSNGPGPETMAPVENVSWADAPSGHYRVVVRHFANHGSPDPTRYRVRVRVGERDMYYSGVIGPDQDNIVAEFDIP
ncbi:MAG: hypothetical protein H6842_00540 [Rhodospirillaceae bacterium]|nr:hypothetical protein [Rhodospirillaceae bacterium]